MLYLCPPGSSMWPALSNGETSHSLCGHVGNLSCGSRNNKLDYPSLCGLYEVTC